MNLYYSFCNFFYLLWINLRRSFEKLTAALNKKNNVCSQGTYQHWTPWAIHFGWRCISKYDSIPFTRISVRTIAKSKWLANTNARSYYKGNLCKLVFKLDFKCQSLEHLKHYSRRAFWGLFNELFCKWH